MIGPGIGGGFVGDLDGFEGDGWIAGAIHALGALQADAQAPVGIIAKSKDKNRVMSRLWCRRTGGELLCRWRILARRQRREGSTEQRDQQSAFGPPRDADEGFHGP